MRSAHESPAGGALPGAEGRGGVAGVQLACSACAWVYEPDRAAFEAGSTGCPRCGGWTWIAQLAPQGVV